MKKQIIILTVLLFTITTAMTKELNFKTPQEQADSLVFFMNKALKSKENERLNWEKKFFSAFPNSFKNMEDIFGYDEKAAPLYSSKHSSGKYLEEKRIFSDVIGFFSELKSIPLNTYFKKYIKINIDGKWDADNISNAFGLHYRILSETKVFCKTLEEFSEIEIKSVFRFIFDGPHPDNEYNEEIYNQLKQKIEIENKHLAMLLSESYDKLLEEDDGHGH